MSDTWIRLPDATMQELCDRLEGFGWYIEHPDISYIEVNFPDPETGHAMQFSGWWLSWRLVDGKLTYGVGDDTAGLRWRIQLDVNAGATPDVVAAAADRAMHLLWHCEDRDKRYRLYDQNKLLRAMETRMQELGRRLMVTPGMVREALKPSTRWTP